MTTPPHLQALQERNLTEIRTRISGMSDLVVSALQDAMAALEQRDRRKAYGVILGDNRIDALQHEVDHLCQVFLVRHMPAGSVLRFIVSALKVVSELERAGDYAEAVAHRAISLAKASELPQLEQISIMGGVSIQLLHAAVDAFLQGDLEACDRVLEDEHETDEMNETIFEALSNNPDLESRLPTSFALVGILTRLERVADRACNIAEHAIYATRGEVVTHGPRGGHKILFLSRYDVCLGPMAEAFANAVAPLTVGFTSCGLQPADACDPRMLAYMAGQGVPVTRTRPRGLDDVGELDAYSVVVTLTREAADECPSLPYRTVWLAWDLDDPNPEMGADAAGALGAALDEIKGRLGDLLDALNLPYHPEKREES